MCGICGELRFDGLPADLSAVERMSEKIAQRGPDHAGVFSDSPLAFGHHRLAIIDLTTSADQPMVDEDLKLVLAFNGTIYWTLDATRPAQPLSIPYDEVLRRLPEAVLQMAEPMVSQEVIAFLAFMRGILTSDACIRRGLYERAYVDKLLAAPEAWFTRIQGSKLWHLALLELWLQLNVDAPRCPASSTGPSRARTETP